MKKSKTINGFPPVEFSDVDGTKCNIQKSSAAEQDLIWLGAEDMELKGFVPYRTPSAWGPITEEELCKKFGVKYVISNTRMHLTREQVKKLLPYLTRFVKTGEL